MNKLQMKRQQTNLTQVEIARNAGITERCYQRYESDKSAKSYREPKVSTAIKIAETLGIKKFQEFCSLWKY